MFITNIRYDNLEPRHRYYAMPSSYNISDIDSPYTVTKTVTADCKITIEAYLSVDEYGRIMANRDYIGKEAELVLKGLPPLTDKQKDAILNPKRKVHQLDGLEV